MRRRIAPAAIWLSLGALFVYTGGWKGLVQFLIFGALMPMVFVYVYFATIHRGRVSPRTAAIVLLALAIPAAAAVPLMALFHGADATLEPHWWAPLVAIVLGAGGCLAGLLSSHPPPDASTPPTSPPRAGTG